MIPLAVTLLSFRTILSALLAALLTVSLSLSAAHAGDMTVKLPMQPTMTSSGHGDFRDCDHRDSGKTKSVTCMAVCAASVIAMPPQASRVEVAEIMTIMPLPEDEVVSGVKPPPGRYPPKTI
jgi:hypothetical protein